MHSIPSQIRDDLYRINGKVTTWSFLTNLYRSPGFKFLFFFRLSKHFSRVNPIGFVIYQIYKHLSIKYGFQIPRSVSIGDGLALPHFGGIVINSSAIIGKNCNILHNVTIGNNKRGKNTGTPVIGDNIYIGPGAILIGGITIGSNSLIAPNSFVNFNVPENSIVIGNPAKIKFKKNASSEFLSNSII